jgi:hypothetical protein
MNLARLKDDKLRVDRHITCPLIPMCYRGGDLTLAQMDAVMGLHLDGSTL